MPVLCVLIIFCRSDSHLSVYVGHVCHFGVFPQILEIVELSRLRKEYVYHK